ncbi:MAG: efflux RND transporter periplasmic adaptor subunit [Gammaproteobacteria bacterium]
MRAINRVGWSVALLILLTACGGLSGNGAASTARLDLAPAQIVQQVQDIETAVAAESTFTEELRFDATLEAIHQATVSAQTNGRVVELTYDVGDHVEKGALLVRFTRTEQLAHLSAVQAEREEAEARLREAQQVFSRAENLFAKKDKPLISKSDYDAADAALRAARARAERAEANVNRAREDLSYTEVFAPYAGIVTARHVQIGETVAPGAPLMSGVSLEALRAVVDVPQQYIAPLRTHRKARIVLSSGLSLDGVDLRIPPNANPETHSFRVLVILPEGNHGVFPGTWVSVRFVRGEAQRLQIPERAVVRRGELTGAYTVEAEGRIDLRYIRVGEANADGMVPVLTGLQAGERYATDPLAAALAYKQQYQ